MTEQGSSFEDRKWAQEQEIESKKWEFERIRNEAERAHDKSNEFHTYVNKAAIDGSNLALRTLVLINGGAAIAMLAFLGTVAKDQSNLSKIGEVAHTLRYFAIGVALACAGMALAYFTHFFMVSVETFKDRTYVHPYVVETAKSRRFMSDNRVFHVLPVLAAAASLAMFVIGMFAASDKVTQLLEKKHDAQIISTSLKQDKVPVK
jgi:hypothetical protein